MPKVDLKIPIQYPDAEGRSRCVACANLTVEGYNARCSHVGIMNSIQVLRECRYYKAKGA